MSFGSKGFERQLKNIAAGKVSRDAINGSQLFTILNTLVSHNYLKYSGDDDDSATNGANAQKVIHQNLDNNKLTLAGGAAADKLSDNNIGVTYAEGANKDADGKDIPAFLTYDSNGNPTTDESKIDPTKTKANPAYQNGKLNIKLAKELQGLTSANFTNTAGNVTTLNADGITIKPNATGKAPVSLTQNGLNNGNNPITNVAGNLAGSKTGTTAPTTSGSLATGADAPNVNNAATVGDVLNAGWNLQNNGAAKDFVKPYDTVNFKNGTGTTAVVDTKTGNLLSDVTFNINSTTLSQNTTTGNIDAGDTGNAFPTAKTVADAINSTRIKYFSVNSTGGKNEDNKGAFITPESTNGIAIGKDATIEDHASIAIGLGARNVREKESNMGKGGERVNQTATSAISIGENATTHFSNAIAMGTNSEARGHSAIVIGHNAKTISPWDDSIDRYNQAYRTTLIGFAAEASGTNTIGIGSRVKALANNAMVFGQDAQSGHVDTIVMGRDSKTQGGTSGSAGSIAIGRGSSSGSADNGRPSTALGASSYVGASFSNPTTNAKPENDAAALTKLRNGPEGLDMSRGATAIGANAGAAYNLIDLLKEDVVDSNTKQTVKAGTPVYRQIVRDEKNNVVEVRFYTSVTDPSDGNGTLIYSYVDMDKINQGYAVNMGTALDNNTEVLKKAGFLNNGLPTPESVVLQETRNTKNGTVTSSGLAYAKTSGASNQQIAVGLQSRAVGNESIAVGAQAIAGDNAVVMGSTSSVNAFSGSYVKVATGDLNTYAANRDQTSQAKDIDLALTPAQGSVLNQYTAQTGRARLPNWNQDNASYGISGSTVVGSQAHSTAPIGVAVGISSTVARGALGAVAVGPVATVEPNSMGAMALGMGSRIQVAANNAIALGTGAEVQSSDASKAEGAMALGWKAKTNKAASVALGSESDGTNRTATKETEGSITHNIAPGVSHTITYSGFAGVPGKSDTLSPNYFVTVGSDTIKRQIKDVAAGNVSATSTDAINGSQLYSVAKLMISGWNIAGDNKTTVEAIAPTEKVSFLNGTGTTSVVARDGDTSNATVTFNVNKSTIGNDTTNTGKVQAADSGDNFATAENVANAINSAYWKAAAGGNFDGTDKGANNITAGTTVTFNAGKNLTVNHTTANNFTFATVANPEFTSVKVGDTVANGKQPVEFKTEAGKTANVNDNQPSTALNVTTTDGKPTQITGIGSVLNTKSHPTNTTTAKQDGNANINKAPLTADQAAEIAKNNANNAATVGDVLNAGFNLQNNGEARDFVKPFDTMNFVNGGNTKAVVVTRKRWW
nr:hypothetical protein [uncultured Haemophilus sp.]